MDIASLRRWLHATLSTKGCIGDAELGQMDDEDRTRTQLYLDHLVTRGAVAVTVAGEVTTYGLIDIQGIDALLVAPEHVDAGPENDAVAVSVPLSLLPGLGRLREKYPMLPIHATEDAFRTIIRSARRELLIASPFLEWDGLGFVAGEVQMAAERGVDIKVLVRGVLTPEPGADYAYLDRVRALLKMVTMYEARRTNPTARLAIRDFTSRITLAAGGSRHYEGIHQKLVIADGMSAYVGSGEIRAASFLVNGEAGIVHRGVHAAFWRDYFGIFWDSARTVDSAALSGTLGVDA